MGTLGKLRRKVNTPTIIIIGLDANVDAMVDSTRPPNRYPPHPPQGNENSPNHTWGVRRLAVKIGRTRHTWHTYDNNSPEDLPSVGRVSRTSTFNPAGDGECPPFGTFDSTSLTTGLSGA